MYLIDFFKSLTKKSNIGTLIWVILNLLVVVMLFSGGFQSWQGILFGIAVYVLSMVIALSPIGEWILRMQTGCKKMTNPDDLARLEPLFREVYMNAKKLNPELPSNIQMFISEDMEPNAFATGRKTVCVTRGLMQYSDEHIKGVLGHEFGHLAHKDTDTILVVSVGNLIVTGFFIVMRAIANFSMWVAEGVTLASSEGWGGVIASIFIGLGRVVGDWILVMLLRLWTQIGVWLCMYSSRQNEFEADKYSHECGYGDALAQVLMSFGTGGSAKGLFAALASSHPDNSKRIEKLRELQSAGITSSTIGF